MLFDFWETEVWKTKEQEAAFAVGRPIEFDDLEIDEADAVEMALLGARIQAARHCGA